MLRYLVVPLLILPLHSIAGDVVGIIERVTILNNLAYLKTLPAPSNKAACATNLYWDYSFPIDNDSGKSTLSMALTAYAGQSPVTVRSKDICQSGSDLEDLHYLILEPLDR